MGAGDCWLKTLTWAVHASSGEDLSPGLLKTPGPVHRQRASTLWPDGPEGANLNVLRQLLNQGTEILLTHEDVEPGQGRACFPDHVHGGRSEGRESEVDGQPAQVSGYLRECSLHRMGLYPRGVREKRLASRLAFLTSSLGSE